MTQESEFSPRWASPPGETIADILSQRSISLPTFARLVGCTNEDVEDLLSGRTTITEPLAERLAGAVGSSAAFWLTREAQFRRSAVRLGQMDQDWILGLPFGEMVAFGWLRDEPSNDQRQKSILSFFGASTISAARSRYAGLERSVAFRRSRAHRTEAASLAAWLRQGEREAEKISCGPWNPQQFRIGLGQIRQLTNKKQPGNFIPALQEICRKSGVAVAVVRTPTGCPSSGATRFLSQSKALLMLSFRYLTDDQFWFTFFHEAGHLLLHPASEVFLEDSLGNSNEKEAAANLFAFSVLIQENLQEEFRNLNTSAADVTRFALRAGISPGIVVGQLQHDGRIRFAQLNGLKRRYKWST